MSSLKSFHYPRYNELPEELIFLDELVVIINETHSVIPQYAKNNKARFTSSMASNYVKQKLTPPPVGKRYTSEHVCMILLAATLKFAFSAEDTIALTKAIFAEGELEETQNKIAEAFERALLSEGSNGFKVSENSLIDLVAVTFASKISALILLNEK